MYQPRPSESRNLYYRLGDIPPDATFTQVDEAYKAALARWDPSKSRRTEERRGLEAQIRAIQEAHRILSNPLSRMEYDAWHAAFGSAITRLSEYISRDLQGFASEILTGSNARITDSSDASTERQELLEEFRRVDEMGRRIIPSDRDLLEQVSYGLKELKKIYERRLIDKK